MVQNVSKQFLEAAMKYNQAMAQSTNGSKDSTFQNYMKDVSSKRDTAPKNDNVSKKDAQKLNEQPSSRDDAATKKPDDSSKVTDDKADNVKNENPLGKEEDTEKASNSAQGLIDLSALLMQMSGIVPAETPATAVNISVDGEVLTNTPIVPVVTAPQGEQQVATVIAKTPQQLMAEVANAQEKPNTTNATANLAMEKAAEKPAETMQTAIKPETFADKTAKTVQAAQLAKSGETEANVKTENNQALKEAVIKAGDAKPIEIKVEVKTQQGNTEAGKNAKTDETAEAAILQAKPQKAEMPVITVKVGDGGQINTPQMTEDVADAIIEKMSGKVNEFEIQITPKELGTITIKLLFENGQTIVSLASGNAKTAELLSESAKTIGALIQQHTGNQTVVTVQDDKSFTDQQKQQGNRENAENQQQENAKKQQRQPSQDFVQQMRLGLFEGDFVDSSSRFY